MKAVEAKVGMICKSRVNPIARGCTYEILECKKTVCRVRLYENGKPTEVTYKSVPYRVLVAVEVAA